ncbi:MAG TPA: hypothetical protein VFZ65_07765 [Planctomycetota bacterium]|nr:hypothetical protein [Planctomycetota bacterium]
MRTRRSISLLVAAMAIMVVACSITSPRQAELHRWWAGFGLVVSHEKFPADCHLCHVGASWNQLATDFRFDHGVRTGVPLFGAHAEALCLRCHNDRGPVATFQAQGCVGCHADAHFGELGPDCRRCHDESTWFVPNARTAHLHTRFPLTGSHLMVACNRCHAGSTVGNFRPTDPDCSSCHYDEAAQTTNPPHIGLGWIDLRCDRCHMTTKWNQAIVR